MSGLDKSGDKQLSIEQEKQALAARLEQLRGELGVLQEELLRNNRLQLQFGEPQKEEVKAKELLDVFERDNYLLQDKIRSKIVMITTCEKRLSALSGSKRVE